MNIYLMAIRRYFCGYEEFEIEAENKQDAVEKSKEYVRITPPYSGGNNYDVNDVKCIKKLQKKGNK